MCPNTTLKICCIIFSFCFYRWLEPAQVQRGQQKVLVSFKISILEMFYFSTTSTPLQGFCSRLNRRLFLFFFFLCGKGSSMFFCRSMVCDLSEMSRTWMTFRGRARSPLAVTCFPSEESPRVLGSQPESYHVANQCNDWLEVIKWLINATFSWRRKKSGERLMDTEREGTERRNIERNTVVEWHEKASKQQINSTKR